MAKPKLALVYGLRMLPAEELESVGAAEIVLKGERKAAVTMHLLEGDTEADLRRQLERSLEAFFEFYPEV